jgi:hypothetical protein
MCVDRATFLSISVRNDAMCVWGQFYYGHDALSSIITSAIKNMYNEHIFYYKYLSARK